MKLLVPSLYTFLATLFVSATLCFYPLAFSYYTIYLPDCFIQLIREGKKQKVDSALIFVRLLILALSQACLSSPIAVSPHLLKLAKQQGKKSGIAPSPVMNYDSSFLWQCVTSQISRTAALQLKNIISSSAKNRHFYEQMYSLAKANEIISIVFIYEQSSKTCVSHSNCFLDITSNGHGTDHSIFCTVGQQKMMQTKKLEFK